MEKEKVTKAAKRHAYDNYDRSYTDRKEGFEACAEWFMEQPLMERLNVKEKEYIRNIYNSLSKERYSLNSNEANRAATIMTILGNIFSKDLFEN